MRLAARAVLDWFIPQSTTLEGAELGLARTFVFSHLLGPVLIQSIAVAVTLADPHPGPASWGIIGCITAFWFLPLGLRLTNDLGLMAMISVELLCVTSLLGTCFYGGVGSPFLPWLLVSLMLGFFYLSDRVLLVLGMFCGNIVATLIAQSFHIFPQNLSLSDLRAVSWFSMFSAVAYMSWMAIYYANIITLSSELERETEKHRQIAQKLRDAKVLADRTSHGTSIFLSKMSQQLRTPLGSVIADTQSLLDGATSAHNTTELAKINAAGRHLLTLVTEVLDVGTVDPERVAIRVEPFDLNGFAQKLGAALLPVLDAKGNRLLVQANPGLGTVVTDGDKLSQIVSTLVDNAGLSTVDGLVTLSVRRNRSLGGDSVEVQVRDTGAGIAPDALHALRRLGQREDDKADDPAGLASCYRSCTALGGTLDVDSEVGRGSTFVIRVPAAYGDGAQVSRSMVAETRHASAI